MTLPKIYEELATGFIEFTARLRDGERGFLPLDDYSFVNSVWKDFQSREVAEMLVHPLPTFSGHREILFAAYAILSIAPHRPELRQQAIALQVLSLNADAERVAVQNFAKAGAAADFIARYLNLSPSFYDQIYYPIGGLAKLNEYQHTAPLTVQIGRLQNGIRTMVALARIFHYVVNNVQGRTGRRPSLNGSFKVLAQQDFRRLEGSFLGESAVEGFWRERRQTISLIYAASSIEVGGGTMLQRFLEGRFAYGDCKEVVPTWLGRARYFSEVILSQLPEPAVAAENLLHLPQIALQPIPVPSFSVEAEKAIIQVYR